MKNKKRALPPLPKGASEKEINRWAKTNDVFDRLDAGVSELVDGRSDLVVFRKEILDSLKKVAGKGGVENVLTQGPEFTAMLKGAERQVKKGRGIKHRNFWKAAKKAK
jgi:hypothetical protein